MSSVKHQKESTKTIKEEPVQIKTEKADLHPLSHYVGDRIELAKQIFSSLKTKTIRNLAPGFLKEAPIDEIKELCLNELLGLSTKRLLSVINAEKCPTDTESSSDSDVKNVEEHISLEEISSDSETEGKHKNKHKKKRKKVTTKQEKNSTEDGTGGDKTMSVLELLELQARARAIRSQLALEPVAKIEVDSDSDEKSQNAKTGQASTSKSTTTTTEKQLTNGNKSSTDNSRKRIKLKRNFRKANANGGENTNEADNNSKKGKSDTENDRKDSDKKHAEGESSKVNDERERSESPDVITILPSPETLLISDSSDEEPGPSSINQKNSENAKNENKSAGLEKSDQSARVDLTAKTTDASQEKTDKIATPEKSQAEKEDGEIDDCEEIHEAATSDKTGTKEPETTTEIVENETSTDKPEDITDKEQSAENKGTNENQSPKQSGIPDSTNESNISNKSEDEAGPSSDGHSRIDEAETDFGRHNDDAISLGHDDLDDLHDSTNDKDISMPSVDVTKKNEPLKKVLSVEADNDIITLDNSSDDETSLGQFADSSEGSSWHSRWLKSDKVNKILVTSRLGNRLRDKIKKSKKQSDEVEKEESVSETLPEEVFQSQYEDGSVQQYAEILERNKT